MLLDRVETNPKQMFERRAPGLIVEEIRGPEDIESFDTQPALEFRFNNLLSEVRRGLHREPIGFLRPQTVHEGRSEPAEAGSIGPAQPFEADADQCVDGGA